MPNVAIVTDTVASIPEPVLEELQIHTVPYYLHWGEEVLRDLVTIDRDTFYKRLAVADLPPKTASPGPGDYMSIYQRLVEEEGVEQIASIHMTSWGSGAYQAAKAAKETIAEMLPRLQLEVIDTMSASMAHGWMVIEAARDALSKKSLDEVVGKVRSMMPVTQMIQTGDTLKYLYLGGRIGKAKHLIGSLLNIKPLIGMQNGVIVALGTARSRKQAYQMIVGMIEKAAGVGGKIKIAYVHAAALEEAQKLRELVEGRMSVAEWMIAELSPALGVYTGPGTAGVCFYPVKE